MKTGNSTQTAGVVNLYKPPGPSSAQYVYRLRPILGMRKIGHAGTLDPFADGVLLACVGRATALVERLMTRSKRYRTTLRLGVTNETHDPERPFLPVEGARPVGAAAVEAALAGFVGEIDQVPPAFSAVKVRGTPSYRRARRGGGGELRPRPVRVHSISIRDYAWPRLELEIHCGRGTYIRAIARDLGRILGCGACCETLTRTAVGPFSIDEALHLETASHAEVRAALCDPDAILDRLRAGSRDAPPA